MIVRRKRGLRLLLAVMVLAACRGGPPSPAPTAPPNVPASATPAPATPSPATPTVPPTAEGAARAYLSAWQAGDYAAMYALLAPESQSAYPPDQFEQQYRANLAIMSTAAYTPTLGAVTETGAAAEAQAHLTYSTNLAGVLETDVTLPLAQADGRWGVVFGPAMIWPELVDGQQLYMVPFVPDRGTIYDRNGVPLVAETDAVALGVVPAEVEDHEGVQAGLGRLLGVPSATIKARYEFAAPDLYLPLGEVSAAEFARFGYLANVAGVRATPYTSRYYYGNGTGAHITGYTTFIAPEQLAEFQARGYSIDQRVGATGIEGWGETALAGRNGGQLTLLDAAGNPLRAIASSQPSPAQDITTTLDFDLQQAAQFALGDFTAAAVVLSVQTGEVLALVSSPTFDPNLFDPNNLNFQFADNGQISAGLLNRATQDAYAAGSVFKIVTFSAGLTSGLFTPDSLYSDTGVFDEVLGFRGLDWKEGGHGRITLMEGLSGSCNPYFWHVGKALHDWNPDWLPETARAFGLGQATGLDVLPETPGFIPDPAWKQQTSGRAWEVLDSLNLAIGQGDVQVTPLQIARLVAAVGNQGTLMQPQLVRRVAPPEGEPSFQFRPSVAGQLPLNQEQLTALQTAMHNVTQEPLGTARNRFRGLRIPVAGKTGTAETGIPGVEDPHAWFAGYTFAGRPDKPDIAIAVWVSNRGQGSDIAAPIFRRILEAYFGLPLTRYPWEESVGVVAQPTPTPTPEGEAPLETETPAP